MKAVFGAIWLIIGSVWLRRGIRDEVHPKARLWKILLGVFSVLIGFFYILGAIFRH